MEKDYIFLGEEGITDTTASRIADLSKLSYTSIENELDELNFVTTTIETINGEQKKVISKGRCNIDDIPAKIKRMGDLKVLNAWLREAVKAHQNVINETNLLSMGDFYKECNKEAVSAPSKPAVLTTNDILALFDIKKRNRYYSLEAHAATLGCIIHENKAFDKARKEMYTAVNNPCTTTGNGNDIVIYNKEPSMFTQDVDNMFYSLQQEHAKYQSELNALKSEIKSRITNDEIDKQKEYTEALEKYRDEHKKVVAEYSLWLAEKQKKAQKLKIVIPNELKPLFDEISQLGRTV